jgi:hypothetical protein
MNIVTRAALPFAVLLQTGTAGAQAPAPEPDCNPVLITPAVGQPPAPLGPTTAQTGINRAGFLTYVVHGYVDVRPRDTCFTIQVLGLDIDAGASQATLSLGNPRGTGRAHVDDAHVVPNSSARNKLNVRYKLTAQGTVNNIQLHYLVFITSNQMSPWPVIPPPPRVAHHEAGCFAKVTSIPGDYHGHQDIWFERPFDSVPGVSLSAIAKGAGHPLPGLKLRVEIVVVRKDKITFVSDTDPHGPAVPAHFVCFVATDATKSGIGEAKKPPETADVQ